MKNARPKTKQSKIGQRDAQRSRAYFSDVFCGRTPSEQPVGAILSAAKQERIECVLHRALAAHAAPSANMRALQDELRHAVQRRALLDAYRVHNDQKVMRAFGTHGDLIVFKGGALAHLIYREPHDRTRIDLDVFMPHTKRNDIARAMRDLGYEEELHLPSPRRSRAATFYKTFDNDFVHTIDVHFRLVKHAALVPFVQEDEVLARARALPALGAKTLAYEDALWLCALHHFASPNKAPRLISLIDMARLIDAGASVKRAREHAKRFRCLSVLNAALDECAQFFDRPKWRTPHRRSDISRVYLSAPKTLYPLVEVMLSEAPFNEIAAHVYPSKDYLQQRFAVSKDVARWRLALGRLLGAR